MTLFKAKSFAIARLGKVPASVHHPLKIPNVISFFAM
jgi:hypothetical protein